MSAAFLVGALILGTLAAPDGAPASPPTVEGAPAPGADAANDQAIAELAELAARQFDQRDLATAEETLRKAIALSPRPGLFYNLAQVYRADGHCAAARDAYREFLARASAGDPIRARAERRLKEMQDCADRAPSAQRGDSATSAGAASPPAPPAARPSPPPVEGVRIAAGNEPVAETARWPRPARLVGWGLIGAGVLAEVGALLFQLKAKRIETDLDNNTPPEGQRPGLFSEGRRDARWALGLALAGGALGAAGGATLIITRDRAATPAHTAIVGWTGAF